MIEFVDQRSFVRDKSFVHNNPNTHKIEVALKIGFSRLKFLKLPEIIKNYYRKIPGCIVGFYIESLTFLLFF